MIAHPEDSIIERFAIGALDDIGDADDFIAHVSACDTCAAKLQREAVLELALIELSADATGTTKADDAPDDAVQAVPSIVPRDRWSPAKRYAAPAVFAFAAAAAVALWVSDEKPRPMAGVQAVADCPDGPARLECLARALREGRTLEYPQSAGIIGNGTGLTVDIRFEKPDPPAPGFEAVAATLRQPIADCINAALNVQSSAQMSGSFDINSVIAADGHVASADLLLRLNSGNRPPVREPGKLASCIETAWKAAQFSPPGESSRVVTSVSFVWRE